MTDLTMTTTSPAPAMKHHRPARAIIASILKHAVLIMASIAMIYPLLWLVVSSFKPNDQIFTNLSIFTKTLTTRNYTEGWNSLKGGYGYSFGQFILNSCLLSAIAIVGNLISCSMAAYAFARLKFKGHNLLFGVMLVTIMMPFQVVIIPQFTIFKALGWVNTFAPLMVPRFLAVDAFFIFFMVQFLRALPNELFEAARLDGAGSFSLFYKIAVPLMTPAMAASAIFTFIWTWSDFFGPLLYLRMPNLFPVSIALKGFIDAQSTSDYGGMFAMSVVSLVPLFFVFLFGQKYLIRGIATTGGK